MSGNNGNEVSIKVEPETDGEENDPLMLTVPAAHAEHEVSFISVCS
jgi:hypothetical protein